ncbi:DUF805 domain-containing protein [Massilia sp. P8910]|uniref:DUF805 domain-containing protein n=1 Tax=Massilia antarctica TaxID=2765360 RepID=UPI001E407501|nr:DUF805 domain-containing protein [Massilia antarctica]MCE3604758.1 DUF805 domain-containing protein [Massilia antarctica]
MENPYHNPYTPPGAGVLPAAPAQARCTPRMLALNGRIGRVRYLVYVSLLTSLLVGATVLMVAALLPVGPLTSSLALLMLIPLLGMLAVMARRRLNDLGRSGWWCVLGLVPFVNLVVGLWPLLEAGNPGENAYGLPPPPNGWQLVLAAWVLPLAMLLCLPTCLRMQYRWNSIVAAAYVDMQTPPGMPHQPAPPHLTSIWR